MTRLKIHNEGLSTWENLCNYLNSLQNRNVTRQEILRFLWTSDKTAKTISDATIDKYRRWLTAAGFLEDVKRGMYKVMKHINVTSSECEKLAYPHRFENQCCSRPSRTMSGGCKNCNDPAY